MEESGDEDIESCSEAGEDGRRYSAANLVELLSLLTRGDCFDEKRNLEGSTATGSRGEGWRSGFCFFRIPVF